MQIDNVCVHIGHIYVYISWRWWINNLIFVWNVCIYEYLSSHLNKLKSPRSPCFALVIKGWGRRETNCSINEGSLGIIWNWQLEQAAAAKISEFSLLWRLLKLDEKFDLLSGLLQIGQNDSEERDPLGLILCLFWRLRVANGTLESWISGILLKWNGVSFPAVRTIVHSREGFSSWKKAF